MMRDQTTFEKIELLNQKKPKRRGFTLVELLLVIAILWVFSVGVTVFGELKMMVRYFLGKRSDKKVKNKETGYEKQC